MTTEEAVARLQKAADAETVRGLAARLDIDAGYLCHVLKGRKDPEHILRRFGLQRIVSYRRTVASASDEALRSSLKEGA